MNPWRDPSRRRWLLWLLLAAVYLLVSLFRLSTAVLSDDLTRAFEMTATELGNLHAAFFYVYAPLQILSGALADRFGARRSAAAGGLTLNAGAVVFGFADGYAAALAGRLLMGVGASVVFIAILRFCANWYRKEEFAAMSGFTVAVSGVGGIAATAPLALLVSALGWRAAVLALASFGLLASAAIYLFVRDSPRDAGLPPVDGVAEPPEVSFSDVLSNLKDIVSRLDTWVIGLVMFCATGVNITVFGLWGVPYIVQVYGSSVVEASYYVLLGSVGFTVGPPAIGRLSDRTGVRKPLMVASGAIYTLAYLVVAVTVDPPLAVVGAAFFVAGFFTGGLVLALTVVKERHSATASGTALGTVNGAAFVGAAVFPTAMGAALDVYWTGETVAGSRVYSEAGYQIAFALAAAAGAVATVTAYYLYLRD